MRYRRHYGKSTNDLNAVRMLMGPAIIVLGHTFVFLPPQRCGSLVHNSPG